MAGIESTVVYPKHKVKTKQNPKFTCFVYISISVLSVSVYMFMSMYGGGVWRSEDNLGVGSLHYIRIPGPNSGHHACSRHLCQLSHLTCGPSFILKVVFILSVYIYMTTHLLWGVHVCLMYVCQNNL